MDRKNHGRGALRRKRKDVPTSLRSPGTRSNSECKGGVGRHARVQKKKMLTEKRLR